MTSAAKTIVLITGANSGVGYELAAQLMARGSYHVLLGSRSHERGSEAVKRLQAREPSGSVELIQLDVTDDETIEQAAQSVKDKHGRLDMLVNNAGVAAMNPPLRQQMRDAFDTNATGTAMVTNFFAELLRNSTASSRRIVNISSGFGSIGRLLDTASPMRNRQDLQYRASKAALNMITACQWVEYGPLGFKVFAYCPGFTQSNLSGMNKSENGAKTAAEAVMPLIDVLEGKRDDEAGKFLHNTGVYPW